jgi:hypothetical protein
MQTSMQNEKESQQEAEKKCVKSEAKEHPQPNLKELLKSVGDCV